MNCNILESLMLLLLLVLLRGCCRRQARTEMPIYCLLPAYCPRDNRESTTATTQVASSCAVAALKIQIKCKHMRRPNSQKQQQTTNNCGVDTELMFSWFLLLPKVPKLLMCTIFQRRSASTFKWQKWRDNNSITTTQATSTTIVQ